MYKIIDGVLYETKEVDTSQLRIEFEQYAKVLKEKEGIIRTNNDQIKAIEIRQNAKREEFLNKLSKIDEETEALTRQYRNAIEKANESVERIKERAKEKEEILKVVSPDVASQLGF